MKGKVNVLSEVNILMIVYNLRRCLTILGIDGFKKRLKDLANPFAKINYIFCLLILMRCAFVPKKRNENFVLEFVDYYTF